MKKLFILTAALFAATSCADQSAESVAPSTAESKTYYITVGMGENEDSRIAIDDNWNTTWQADDAMILHPTNIFGEEVSTKVTMDAISDDATTATFSFEQAEEETNEYRLIYPYADVTPTNYLYTFDYSEQTPGLSATYMVSKQEFTLANIETKYDMYHVGAAVDLTLNFTNPTAGSKLTKIVVSGAPSAVSADLRYIYSNASFYKTTSYDDITITVDQAIESSMNIKYNTLPYTIGGALVYNLYIEDAEGNEEVFIESIASTDTFARGTHNTVILSCTLTSFTNSDPVFGGYYDGGIIYEVAEDESYAMVFSLTQTKCALALEAAQYNDNDYLYESSLAISTTDGVANTEAIVGSTNYSEENFPAVAWCVAMGDDWYLPSEEELAALLTAVADNIGVTLTDPTANDTACTEALNATISAAITTYGGVQFLTNTYYYPSNLAAAAKANIKEIQTDKNAIIINTYNGAIANSRYVRAIKKVSLVE